MILDAEWKALVPGDRIRYIHNPQILLEVAVDPQSGLIRGWGSTGTHLEPLKGQYRNEAIHVLEITQEGQHHTPNGPRWNLFRRNVGEVILVGYGEMEIGEDPGL